MMVAPSSTIRRAFSFSIYLYMRTPNSTNYLVQLFVRTSKCPSEVTCSSQPSRMPGHRRCRSAGTRRIRAASGNPCTPRTSSSGSSSRGTPRRSRARCGRWLAGAARSRGAVRSGRMCMCGDTPDHSYARIRIELRSESKLIDAQILNSAR